MDILKETDEVEKDVAHRAARLFQFDKANYRKAFKNGMEFKL